MEEAVDVLVGGVSGDRPPILHSGETKEYLDFRTAEGTKGHITLKRWERNQKRGIRGGMRRKEKRRRSRRLRTDREAESCCYPNT